MFGMLDYRAHKLYWLLTSPLRLLLNWLGLFAAIATGIMVAHSTNYSWWAKILIAFAAFFLAGLILDFLIRKLASLYNRAFFWIVDVMPAKGVDENEVRAIVLSGELPLLMKKLNSKVEDWTEEDTQKVASYAPWRCRLFFRRNIKERFRARVRMLQQQYAETGIQLADLPSAKANELLKPYYDPWYERMLAHYGSINVLIASVFIVMFANS